MGEWLEAGASIPNDPELAADLTGITFDYARLKVRHGSIILESKDEAETTTEVKRMLTGLVQKLKAVG